MNNMENNIIINEKLLNYIIDQESKKIVGKVCKRFELSEDKEAIKKEIKELLYEFMRDFRDFLVINGKEAIKLTRKE